MGSCLCKEKAQVNSVTVDFNTSTSSSLIARGTEPKRSGNMDNEPIEPLIIEVLRYIGTVQQGHENAITPINRIQSLAYTDEGWCDVVLSLLRTIPFYDPLGPSAITIILDEIPLPSRETLVGLTISMNINSDRCVHAYRSDERLRYERNVLVLLGCIAEKFAGPQSVEVFTDDILDYLVQFLIDEKNAQLALHALIALEKFASTTENKVMIERAFNMLLLHPLLPLHLHSNSPVYSWREVGFCARWALDNIFLVEKRRLTYETQNMENINAMLNITDISQYLKLSSDGLEARSDSHLFESVRGTFEITGDAWYYEVEIMTAGVMQIGWATLSAEFKNHDGFGVGDDSFSLAYDGCRRLIWHKAEATPTIAVPSWQVGDILGCLIDVSRQEAVFSLNGVRMEPCADIFANTRVEWIESERICSEGFYAAASFMAHQQCRFNFGHKDFEYPPTDRQFSAMNQFGYIEKEKKKVKPRHLVSEEIQLDTKSNERRCTVCFEDNANYGIQPCEHGEFCLPCVKKLKTCPLCRGLITDYFILAL